MAFEKGSEVIALSTRSAVADAEPGKTTASVELAQAQRVSLFSGFRRNRGGKGAKFFRELDAAKYSKLRKSSNKETCGNGLLT